jgi:hypothetical protein
VQNYLKTPPNQLREKMLTKQIIDNRLIEQILEEFGSGDIDLAIQNLWLEIEKLTHENVYIKDQNTKYKTLYDNSIVT